MIDIQKAKQVFKEYIQDYDLKNGLVKLKVAHMYRVTEISKKIAEELRLDKEDIQLAELIGLLHDIGRFEQIRIYETFEDSKSIDHAKQGLKVLFEENWIRKFLETDQYDSIIYKAIFNHNKKEIEQGLTPKELLHAKIIRDADKTDIFYIITTDTTENVYQCTKEEMEVSEITEEIVREYKEEGKIDYQNRKNNADKIISHFAFVFDFNFDYGLKIIDKNKYLEKIPKEIAFKNENTKTKIEEAYEVAKQYMKERLGENNG